MSQPSGGGGSFGGGGASGGWGNDGGSSGGSGGGAAGGGGGAPGGGAPGGGGGAPGGGAPGGGGGAPGGGGGGAGGGGGGAGGGGGGAGGGGGGAGGAGGGAGGAGGGAGAGGQSSFAVGKARVAAKIASLEIKDTGNAKLDAMGDVFNNALAPFHTAPPPEQGALGVVNQAIGAVMGLQGLGMELMNTGFAMATAGIAAAMPAFPAAFLTVPHVGMPHAHAHPPSLIPPAPPVPLPSIGTLLLAGSVGVLVCGMPAGRCGDLGLAVTCGSFSPAFDVFLGSSNTFIAGNRAARMLDMTRHCNPASAALAVSRGAALFSAAVGAVGVAADAAGGGAVTGSIAQIAADLAAAAMSALLGKDPGVPPAMGALMMGAPTVLIGGFPCPNLPDPLSAMMKGLKCLTKAFAKSKAFGKVLKKVGLCNSPGEPINPFTGEVYNDFEDYRDPETGFVWERHYRSGWNEQDGPLGFGFRHFYDRRLTFQRKRALYETHDNERVALAKGDDGAYAPMDGFTLTSADGKHFQLTTDRDETLDFELVPTTPATGRLLRFRQGKLDVYLFYNGKGQLRALSEHLAGAVIDTHVTHDQNGRIQQVSRGPRGAQLMPISGYRYAGECISEWQDALGAVARYRYDDARRMVQGTDRRSYSFHWHYDARTGRCIKSYGDDGLWGVEAQYQGSTSTFTEPDGGIWTFKHYPDGAISHMVDPLGGVMQYLQDDRGRIIKQITPAGLEYTWLYDGDGKHIGRFGPFGDLVPPEDDQPNPPSALRHRGPTTPFEWIWGRPHVRPPSALRQLPTAVRNVIGAVTSSPLRIGEQRDAGGRLLQATYNNGAVEYFQRDAEGNLAARLDTKGNWWQQQVTSWNMTSAERTPLGSVTQYGYTHRQKVSSITDPNGNVSEYRRDKAQRIVEIVQNGTPYLRYVRSRAGSLLEERDGAGKLLVQHAIDDLGLHTQTTLASGEDYTYAYDEIGNVTEASSSQHKVERRYIGRIVVADLRDGLGIRRGYGQDGLENSIFLDRFWVEYETTPRGLRVSSPDGQAHTFWSDVDGVMVREYANGTSEAMLFDARQQLVVRACFRTQDGSINTVWATTYTYDADGSLEKVHDSELGLIQYQFDADQRLIGQQGPATLRFDYRYDMAGNLTFTPSHGDIERGRDNLLKHSHFERFEYDDRYRLAKRVRADGTEVSYIYDSADQLIEARFSDRSQVWRAAYDGLGRRLWREYGGARTNFYWDKDRLAGEMAPDGSLRVYVYANEDVLVPFMWLDYAGIDADPTTGVARYLFCAPTGMPLRVEDASGGVVWQAGAIEPYGRSDKQALPVRLRFAGHFYDEDLELFYNRFRDYDPTICRYLQPDPLGHAGGINLYAYPANPAAQVDLRGLVHKAKSDQPEGGDQPGDKKPEKKPKEPLEELEVGSYRAQNKKDAESVGMDRDHIPSKAAVKRAMEDAGLKVKPTTVDGNLTSVAIDRETHKEGRTYGNKNDDAQVAADAKDLRAAADKDLAEHRKALEGRDPPVPAEDIDAMEAAVHKRNEELGLYDKPLDPVKLQKLNKPIKE